MHSAWLRPVDTYVNDLTQTIDGNSIFVQYADDCLLFLANQLNGNEKIYLQHSLDWEIFSTHLR